MTPDESRAAGRAAFAGYSRSRHFAGMVGPLEVRPEDAEKVYLPVIDEGPTPMQIARPIPAARLAWRAGFAEAQAEAVADLMAKMREGGL